MGDFVHNKLKLLLVEDDEINAKIILRFIEDEYTTDWVRTGIEAIELAETGKYDGIMMDISLIGELDGLMATERVRKIPGYSETPIIAVTAYAMVGDKEKFLKAGCSHYIAKPFSKSELLVLLRKIFD